ncbi:dipeptide/oligopeptide/nickel ABC transporter ATP-binding protein [Pollutimonas nitritireducens]|uniref:Dipeptide/oligopeptide/nickel ABC transporter ATP-binding protein n=1 Tax=Pollutimonas nitritireducens TaxID=2045209 RepID=A0A2N4UE33_9BURK|nr:ABC transporter ATP-binding protein [Pollutimonas nitritireducens]PLC53271.1 dipeptide/oligopeptide/nickel ABC transporter ATP-binding protein [Pollutimonas nitritireducens]
MNATLLLRPPLRRSADTTPALSPRYQPTQLELPYRPSGDVSPQTEPLPSLQQVQSPALISIRNLRVSFEQNGRIVPILHGIDLEIQQGEAVGIVGESGCGKSITWLAILGLLGKQARVEGSARLKDQEILNATPQAITQIRGKRIAMIFQDPSSSLNPAHRIGTQVAEAVALHQGLGRQAAKAEAKRLLERVRIPNAAQRLQAYPHELSGGMNQRVMIAIALAGKPDLLVADEPTTALDATVQAQIIDLLKEIRVDSGMALALISHDLGVIADVSDRVMVMYAGRVVESAATDRLFSAPMHPYTRGLIAALPDLESENGRLEAIMGTVPEAGKLPSGCGFRPRCQHASDSCASAVPPLLPMVQGHHVACLKADVQ